MDTSLNVICFALFFVIFRVTLSASIDPGNNANGEPTENAINSRSSSQSEQKYSSVWFDQKMGKQKLSDLLRDKSKIAHVFEFLNEYPCSIFTVNDITGMQKRGNNLNYTPRLGRTLEDAGVLRYVGEGSSFSSPQSGRRLYGSAYSPRLGRDESENYL